jgi:hypothetical protein
MQKDATFNAKAVMQRIEAAQGNLARTEEAIPSIVVDQCVDCAVVKIGYPLAGVILNCKGG